MIERGVHAGAVLGVHEPFADHFPHQGDPNGFR